MVPLIFGLLLWTVATKGKTKSPVLFERVFFQPRIPWNSVLASGVLHCIACLILLVVSAFLERPAPRQRHFSRPLHAEILYFPDRAHFARAVVAVPPRPSSGRQSAGAISRRLAQTLIRPELPPTYQDNVALPSFLIWSALPTAPQNIPVKQKLGMEAASSDIPRSPALQVLSIAPVPLPLPRSLELPPLNQMATETGLGKSVTVGQTVSGDSIGSGSLHNIKPAEGDNNVGTTGAGLASAGKPVLPKAAAPVAGAAIVTPVVSSIQASAEKPSAEHSSSGNAASSNFDVVIVQSSPDGGIPDAANSLHGRPIYTVYLQVDDWKEWILEYCIPDSGPAEDAPRVVQLDNVARIEPPYPLSTTRPSVEPAPGTSYFLLHGLIDTEGKPVDFKAVDTGDPQFSEAAIAAIRSWKFRPARRDGVPVQVEAVLAIPCRQQQPVAGD